MLLLLLPPPGPEEPEEVKVEANRRALLVRLDRLAMGEIGGASPFWMCKLRMLSDGRVGKGWMWTERGAGRELEAMADRRDREIWNCRARLILAVGLVRQ